MASYRRKLKDPRWKQKREEIYARDTYQCQLCGKMRTSMWLYQGYRDRDCEPWEQDEEMLHTVCAGCFDELAETRMHIEYLIGLIPPRELDDFLTLLGTFLVVNDGDRDLLLAAAAQLEHEAKSRALAAVGGSPDETASQETRTFNQHRGWLVRAAVMIARCARTLDEQCKPEETDERDSEV